MGRRGPKPRDPVDLFKAKRREKGEDDCWLWEGGKSGNYGAFNVHRKPTYAHIFAYTLAYGPVPAGCDVHHTCQQTLCVNPRHLEAKDRIKHRSDHAKTDVCRKGHELTTENTYQRPNGGTRCCRTCRDVYMAEYRTRQVA